MWSKLLTMKQPKHQEEEGSRTRHLVRMLMRSMSRILHSLSKLRRQTTLGNCSCTPSESTSEHHTNSKCSSKTNLL